MGSKPSHLALPPPSRIPPTAKPPLTTWQLPTDLVERVAFFLPDSISFFAWLDALNTSDGGGLGDLVHFLALRGHIHPTVLWPHSPCLRYPVVPSSQVWPHQDATPFSLASLAAVARYHSVVELPHGLVVDMGHFRSLLPSSIVLHLRTTSRQPSLWPHEIGSWGSGPCGTYVIPRSLPPSSVAHLDALYMGICTSSTVSAVDELLAFLETSNVTKFSLISPIRFTPTRLGHVVRWLQARPVCEFKFGRWDFGATLDAMASFYTAVAECSTLGDLTLYDVKLPRFPTTPGFALPSHKARVVKCEWNVRDIETLLSCLQNARTLALELPPNSKAWGEAAHRLVLPSLVHLELHYLVRSSIRALCHALSGSAVESVVLTNYETDFTLSESVQSVHCIAEYIPRWPQLKRLDLSQFYMRDMDARALGKGLSQAKRLASVKLDHTKTIYLSSLAPHLATMPQLQTLTIAASVLKSLTSWTEKGNVFSQLFENRSLETVSIFVDEIDGAVVYRLAEALRTNGTIRELACRVAVKDVPMLIEALGARPIPTRKVHLRVTNGGPGFNAKLSALVRAQPQEIYMISTLDL
ncbi:Aste57867_3480 [Aphanomyces stellatus]|uniref:Aste57867_3480 protein n=1 Tax=Aphanomyces stellatus TaxID=120398 RepID=A0A485K9S7_9STRA|nr:hypothetical protein As57867_003470 [Aphanomyces stellatus]VFT80645.1 Aste57867_3480 [Aphanomyces stellatus]